MSNRYAAIVNIEAAMSKRYALVDDGASLGAQLEVQQGGLVVTYDTDGTDINRNARCSQAVSDSRWSYEAAFYGNEALSAANAVVGLIRTDVVNTVAPGSVANSFGLNAGTGVISAAGATLATVSAIPKKRAIRMELDLVAGTPTLAFYLDTLLLYTCTLPAGQTWVPALSIGGTTAYGLSAYFNFGRRKLINDPSTNFKPGIFTNTTVGGALYLSDQAVRLPSTGTPANQRYDARILSPETFYIKQGIQFITDGQSGNSFSASDIDLDNQDGAIDFLFEEQPIGAKITYAVLDLDTPGALPIVVATTVIADVEMPDANTIRIKQGDTLARLNVPVQRQSIPPWYDEGAANLPYPISLGAVRNMQPILIDPITNTYLCHDAPLSEINVVRTSGDKLDPTAVPPDWWVTADLRGFQTEVPWAGKTLCDISSEGVSSLTPVSGVDLLNGIGACTTPVSGFPTGFTDLGSSHSNCTVSYGYVATDGGRMRVGMDSYTGAGGGLAVFDFAFKFVPDVSTPLVAGKRYNLTFDVKNGASSANHSGTTPLYYFVQLLRDHGGSPQNITTISDSSPRSFTLAFTASDSGAIYINGTITYDTAGGAPALALPWFVEWDNFKIVQLPDPIADPSENPLAAITFEDYFVEIFLKRYGAAEADWVRADAQAIDTAKRYKFGVSIKDAVDVLTALRAPLDSIAGAVTSDAIGRLRVVEQLNPATVADADLVYVFDNTTNMDGLPTGVSDKAPGLTTKVGAPHNWQVSGDSDFVTDFDPVTGIDAATRTRFKRASQYIRASGITPAHLYERAIDAGEFNSLLDNPDNAEDQQNYLVGNFVDTRIHYVVAGSFDPLAPPAFMCGRAFKVKWKRVSPLARPSAEFEPGKNLLIKEFELYPFAGKIQITQAWG